MKLYVIGTSPQSNIQLRSQYGSSYHAELLLLDNGDMLLTDRGSKNGTYVNGKKITPDKDVNVRRGDEVVFADERLDWNRIPANTVDMTKVKEIRSIGSHHLNRILLQGEHVSRFHATMKRMADGKWYIQDHSKNGTSINGNRIPKDQDVRIKRGDKISCAGHMVPNPMPPGPNWGIIGGVAAAVAIIVALAIWIPDIINKKDYTKAVVWLGGSYHFEILVGDKVVETVPGGTIQGTGFFISEDGKLVTNLHIAKNWVVRQEYMNYLKTTYIQDNTHYASIMADIYDDKGTLAEQVAYNSLVQVRGVLDEMLVVPSGKVLAEQNAYTANIVAASDNIHVDLAVMQLDIESLPPGAEYINLNATSTSDADVKVGEKLVVIGFPAGLEMQTADPSNTKNNRVKLEAYRTEGICTRSGSDINFEHNAMTEGGSSGSPIFDSRGKLIGVNSAHILITDDNNYNVGIDAFLINELLKKSINF